MKVDEENVSVGEDERYVRTACRLTRNTYVLLAATVNGLNVNVEDVCVGIFMK